MASADVRRDLSCSICLNIFKNPVSLSCGHNFCKECIDRALDAQEMFGTYTCPECRQRFRGRPLMHNARALRNIAEKLLISRPYPEDTGIYCTYCVDFPEPAIKSCLHCESSLCGKHLRAHVRSPEHVLFDPNNFPENRICSIHEKILEYYCTKERVCICVYCIAFGEHKLHPVESLEVASEKKKEKSRKDLVMLTSNKVRVEKQVQGLKERSEDVQIKAAGVTEKVTTLFTNIGRELKELETKVLGEISMQTEKISQSVSTLIQQLEIQKDELSRRMNHIEKMCNTTDPMTVLMDQNLEGEVICPTEQDTMDSMIPCEGDFHEDSITERLHELYDFIKYIPNYIPKPEGVLLDEETAANDIQISGDLKTATFSDVIRGYPLSHKRFNRYQVQCKKRFSSGRHCWEVDTSNSNGWRVGLCYPSMDKMPLIGNRKNSWCLRSDGEDYNIVYDNNTFIPFPHRPTSHKFRIYLDYEAGQISFYELSDPIRHIYSFSITFTEPLDFVICLWDGSMTITN